MFIFFYSMNIFVFSEVLILFTVCMETRETLNIHGKNKRSTGKLIIDIKYKCVIAKNWFWCLMRTVWIGGCQSEKRKKTLIIFCFIKPIYFVLDLLEKLLKNKQTSWRHTNSVIESSKIANIKVDVLSTYVLNGSIESKYIVFWFLT